ncbi:hypothetical protein BCR33DRAFT_722688 [Rhizoclosmatium globosum]|uniref:Uncharacterized protein n=1 Tax=Rhizoclosmatium globosum TaxID=329046 RepID=A0A1Y2BK18_9FUNG|nr:hypothetical protein BCR33DRAFT_722688 [Rhizoclosmatium globosum]|eukprot:ORY34455.1 hypothetical protein BCR33DRAFT_722688 [Rhizoclosmatium globosum]
MVNSTTVSILGLTHPVNSNQCQRQSEQPCLLKNLISSESCLPTDKNCQSLALPNDSSSHCQLCLYRYTPEMSRLCVFTLKHC